jgi:hypothetical protein
MNIIYLREDINMISAKMMRLRQTIYKWVEDIVTRHGERDMDNASKNMDKHVRKQMDEWFHDEYKRQLSKTDMTDNVCYIELNLSRITFDCNTHLPETYYTIANEQREKFLNKLRKKGYHVENGSRYKDVYRVSWGVNNEPTN